MGKLDDLQERERDVERQREKLQAKQKNLGIRIEDLRDERDDVSKRVSEVRKREAKLEKKISAELRSEIGKQRACIDGATTWLGLKLVALDVRAHTDWNGVVNAADRTSHADDCGDKLSQAELYAMFLNGTGNPANPPGTGSHEGINGGNGGTPVTSAVPVGAKLPWFRWGLDLSDPDAFVAGAQKLGYKVSRPHSSEPWHCNLTEDPTAVLRKRGRI